MYHLAKLEKATDYSDGCEHPNGVGYAKMGNVWVDAILAHKQ